VVSWFARQGGSAALPSVISRMVFEIFPFFFFLIFVLKSEKFVFVFGVPL
jgi:hypothetical protein